MTRRGLYFFVLMVTLSLVAAGCGGQADPASGKTSTSTAAAKPAETGGGKTVEVKFAHHLSPQSVQNAGVEKFKELVESQSKGQMKVSIYPAGQLGNQGDLIKQVKEGNLQFTLGESGLFANYDKELGVLALPFLFSTYDKYHSVVDGEIGKRLTKKLLDVSGLKVTAFYDGGIRDTYISKKAVNSKDDFKGMKIRTPQSPIYIDTFTALAANPTPIASGEIYTSMQTGLVDAMEGTTETGWTFKIHEVGKYLSRTRHINTDIQLSTNDKWFQSLTKEQQDIILKASKESETYQRDLWQKKEQEFLDKLQKEGKLKVNEPDLNSLKEAVKPVYEKFNNETKSDILAKIQEQTR